MSISTKQELALTSFSAQLAPMILKELLRSRPRSTSTEAVSTRATPTSPVRVDAPPRAATTRDAEANAAI